MDYEVVHVLAMESENFGSQEHPWVAREAAAPDGFQLLGLAKRTPQLLPATTPLTIDTSFPPPLMAAIPLASEDRTITVVLIRTDMTVQSV